MNGLTVVFWVVTEEADSYILKSNASQAVGRRNMQKMHQLHAEKRSIRKRGTPAERERSEFKTSI